MKPGGRGRQLQSVADIAKSARRVILEVDNGLMPASKAQAILAGLRLIFDTMQHSSIATTQSGQLAE